MMTHTTIGVSALWWWRNGRTREGHRMRIANMCAGEIENRCRRQYFTHSPCQPSRGLRQLERACWGVQQRCPNERSACPRVHSRQQHRNRLQVHCGGGETGAPERVTECALQTCAPQKLKIDAGANTSLTRRANLPRTPAARASVLGRPAMLPQRTQRVPQTAATPQQATSPEKRRLFGCCTFKSGTRHTTGNIPLLEPVIINQLLIYYR